MIRYPSSNLRREVASRRECSGPLSLAVSCRAAAFASAPNLARASSDPTRFGDDQVRAPRQHRMWRSFYVGTVRLAWPGELLMPTVSLEAAAVRSKITGPGQASLCPQDAYRSTSGTKPSISAPPLEGIAAWPHLRSLSSWTSSWD